MVSVAVGGGPRACVVIVALTLLSATTRGRSAAAELIFRVPEVQVSHAAADRPVGSARRPAPAPAPAPEPHTHYEEYYVEHDISTVDAKRAAKELKLDEELAIGCGSCSRRELEYCETRVLADHCCCERRHVPESFPWLPHTCYVGPRPCRPLAGDCGKYERLRDCCCYTRMANKWRSILSASPRSPRTPHSLSALTVLLVATCL